MNITNITAQDPIVTFENDYQVSLGIKDKKTLANIMHTPPAAKVCIGILIFLTFSIGLVELSLLIEYFSPGFVKNLFSCFKSESIVVVHSESDKDELFRGVITGTVSLGLFLLFVLLSVLFTRKHPYDNPAKSESIKKKLIKELENLTLIINKCSEGPVKLSPVLVEEFLKLCFFFKVYNAEKLLYFFGNAKIEVDKKTLPVIKVVMDLGKDLIQAKKKFMILVMLKLRSIKKPYQSSK